MTKYLLTLKSEEMKKMREDSAYRSKTIEALTKAFVKIDAKNVSKKQSICAVNIEYQGSLEDLTDNLAREGFGADKIRIGPNAYIKVPDQPYEFDSWFRSKKQ